MFNIIGMLKGLFRGIDALFSWLSQRQLIEAGRKEIELEAHRAALKAMEISQDVDSQPTPADILERLRRDERARG